jgi:hypothetical protein
MNILFCNNVLCPNTVDEAFSDEYECAKINGFNTYLYNHDEQSTINIRPIYEMETIIYRGWMLTHTQYEKLYNELFLKNYKLINDPIEYINCHYLPNSLQFINEHTPKTIFQRIEDKESIDTLIKKSKTFSGKPVIIKDFVKSEKHYWNTACFVENSSDIERLRTTINNFMDLRGEFLNEGIVIREFIELNKLTDHSKSGMPLSEEYRLFFFRNKLLCTYNYWDEGNYFNKEIDTTPLEEIAKNIDSNFFTMDIAKDKTGKIVIIELGDGQVSGIPEKEDRDEFYKKLMYLIKKQKGT